VLVYILGELGTFYIVLLRVYPSTCVLIFIGIGLYLTDTEHKIGWHSFFETRCIKHVDDTDYYIVHNNSGTGWP